VWVTQVGVRRKWNGEKPRVRGDKVPWAGKSGGACLTVQLRAGVIGVRGAKKQSTKKKIHIRTGGGHSQNLPAKDDGGGKKRGKGMGFLQRRVVMRSCEKTEG